MARNSAMMATHHAGQGNKALAEDSRADSEKCTARVVGLKEGSVSIADELTMRREQRAASGHHDNLYTSLLEEPIFS
jgi:hypothetical protein